MPLKKKLLLVHFLLLIPMAGFSQNYIQTQRQTVQKPTNRDLYNLEYELKHYAFNGDSTILDVINFELLPAQREQSVDVEVLDPTISHTIILYSYDRVESNYLKK